MYVKKSMKKPDPFSRNQAFSNIHFSGAEENPKAAGLFVGQFYQKHCGELEHHTDSLYTEQNRHIQPRPDIHLVTPQAKMTSINSPTVAVCFNILPRINFLYKYSLLPKSILTLNVSKLLFHIKNQSYTSKRIIICKVNICEIFLILIENI